MWWTAVQPVLLATVLGWAGAVKLGGRQAATAARRSALGTLLGPRAAPAYRAVGLAELSVAALLLLPAPRWLAAAGAVALATGFLGYLGYARTAAPQSSCGCLSTRRTPIRWRSFARGGLLLAAGLAVFAARSGWLAALRGHPAAAAAVLLGEAALVVLLSPELDHAWLLPARRLRTRLSRPLAGGHGTVPLLASVQLVQRSPAYRRVAQLLRSDVQDYWDQGDWRFLTHAARYDDRAVTVVFAVERDREDPSGVRVAIVDEATGATLLRHEPEPVG